MHNQEELVKMVNKEEEMKSQKTLSHLQTLKLAGSL